MNMSQPSGFVPGTSSRNDRYANPFYGVPAQFMPHTMEDMLWWSNHFLVRFPFYRTALARVANYFITSLRIECDDSTSKRKYQEIFEEQHYKQILAMAGLNTLAYGNLFASVNQGFDRFLNCPKCSKVTSLGKLYDYEFTKEGQFIYNCPSCKFQGKHDAIDKPSKDLKRLAITFWNPSEVLVRHEDTTGESEYFWDIPQDYINKVTKKNNKFYSKKTPKAIYDAISQKKCLAFNNKNFIHLKVATPVGIPSDGKSIPHCIYLFDDFFMLKMLERFNQAIVMEDIVPFRVFSLTNDANPQNNMILHQNATQWQSAVDAMITDHRLDPGAYHKFPFPISYQQLGGNGKMLVTPELIQMHISNLLNALNIPQELYVMNLQTQAVGPALRLFENSWSFMIDIYNSLLNHWGEVIGKVSGLPKAKISLIPVTLADDIEKKSIIGQLVSANAIARSELLNLFGFDYRDQVKKKLEEEAIQQELQQEEAAKKQLMDGAQAGQSNSGTSPSDVLAQAQEIAQKLFPLDGAQRRGELQQIKATDATLYSAVKQSLEEMTSGAKKQGVEQSKRQATTGQP